MEKNIILYKNNKDFGIILHAKKNNNDDVKYQWYLKKKQNSQTEYPLENDIYESFVVSSCSKWYQKNIGMCLFCHKTGYDKNKHEGIYLLNNFIDMIKYNGFDSVDFFDKEESTGQTYKYILSK